MSTEAPNTDNRASAPREREQAKNPALPVLSEVSFIIKERVKNFENQLEQYGDLSDKEREELARQFESAAQIRSALAVSGNEFDENFQRKSIVLAGTDGNITAEGAKWLKGKEYVNREISGKEASKKAKPGNLGDGFAADAGTKILAHNKKLDAIASMDDPDFR